MRFRIVSVMLSVSIWLPAAHARLPHYQVVTAADLGLDDVVDINRHGHVLGTLNQTTVIWKRGQPIESVDGISALAINDNDQVIGRVKTPYGIFQAAIWNAGVVTTIGSLALVNPEFVSSQVMDLNSHGEVVGFSENGPTQTFDWHAFYWSNDAGIVDLGTLGGDNSQAFGINDAGVITGFSEDDAGVLRPVVWHCGPDGWQIHDLGISGEGTGRQIGYRDYIMGEGIYDADIPHGVVFLWNQLSGATPPQMWPNSCAVNYVDWVGDINEVGLMGASGQVVCEGSYRAYLLDLKSGQALKLNELIMTPNTPILQRIDRISNGNHVIARTEIFGSGEEYILFPQ